MTAPARSAVPGTTPVLQPGTYRLTTITARPGHTRSGVPGVATTCQPGTYRLGSHVAPVIDRTGYSTTTATAIGAAATVTPTGASTGGVA